MLEVCNKFVSEQHRIFNSIKSIALKCAYAEEVDAEIVMHGQDNIKCVKIQIHIFIADEKVLKQYKIKIFKLKCYTDFTMQYRI